MPVYDQQYRTLRYLDEELEDEENEYVDLSESTSETSHARPWQQFVEEELDEHSQSRGMQLPEVREVIPDSLLFSPLMNPLMQLPEQTDNKTPVQGEPQKPLTDTLLHKVLGITGSFKEIKPPGGDNGIGQTLVDKALALAKKRAKAMNDKNITFNITIKGIFIKSQEQTYRGMRNVNPWDVLRGNDGLRSLPRDLAPESFDSDLIGHTCGCLSDLVATSRDLNIAEGFTGSRTRNGGWVFGIMAYPDNAIDVNVTMQQESDFEFQKQREIALRGGTRSQDDVPWFQPYQHARPTGYRIVNPFMSFQGWLNAWPSVFWYNVEYYATYQHIPISELARDSSLFSNHPIYGFGVWPHKY